MTDPPNPGGIPPRPQQPPRPRTQPPAQPRPPTDLATRLDGQRGWLNEIDRSLRKRSIIALVLTCLAVGAGAAAIYISVTKNSDSDRINALETRIEALEAASGVVPPETGTTLPGTVVPETGTTLPETGVTPNGVTDTTTPVVPPAE